MFNHLTSHRRSTHPTEKQDFDPLVADSDDPLVASSVHRTPELSLQREGRSPVLIGMYGSVWGLLRRLRGNPETRRGVPRHIQKKIWRLALSFIIKKGLFTIKIKIALLPKVTKSHTHVSRQYNLSPFKYFSWVYIRVSIRYTIKKNFKNTNECLCFFKFCFLYILP